MQPDTIYHIYNRANGSENLFRNDENYRYFLQQWVKYIESIAETYAYCLMPNHFHFLIRTLGEDQLKMNYSTLGKFGTFQELMEFRFSKQFANLFSSYTQAYNKMYKRRGSLFTPNFKKNEINSDTYLTNIIFYIHRNPVHHGFTNKIKDWPFCSYLIALSEQDTFLNTKEIIDWFGSKNAFKQFHEKSFTDAKKLKTMESKYTG